MRRADERLFALLLRAYPRPFRERYADDLLEFFRAERRHPRFGTGLFRPVRFWIATMRDLVRTAASERFPAASTLPTPNRATLMRTFADLLADGRYALRSLRATPAVTITALLVLTLGIGVSTAIFSVVDGIVLRNLPFEDPDQLMAVTETQLPDGRRMSAAYANYVDWAKSQDVFESLAASAYGRMLTTRDAERPEALRSYRITANLLDVLRVEPAIGSGITSHDIETNNKVALISDGLWRRRFNADPGVVGKPITFESGVYTVAGVMPAGFTYPVGSTLVSKIDLWVPSCSSRAGQPPAGTHLQPWTRARGSRRDGRHPLAPRPRSRGRERHPRADRDGWRRAPGVLGCRSAARHIANGSSPRLGDRSRPPRYRHCGSGRGGDRIICGLVPALQMSRADVSGALRASARGATVGRGGQRARTAFLVGEVALAAALLVGAGIFTSSFLRLVRTDLGFQTERRLSLSVNPAISAQDWRRARPEALHRAHAGLLEALSRVQALPGIESAALAAGGVPLIPSYATADVRVGDRLFEQADAVMLKQVTGDYLQTVGATLLRGRSIEASDRAGAPLVIVLNDEAARRYFPQRDPIGEQIRIEREAPRTVVGVVRGMRVLGPETELGPEGYVPLEQAEEVAIWASLVIHTAGDPRGFIPAIKGAIWSAVPDAVIPEPTTFDERFAGIVAQRKLNMVLLTLFGGLALLIAAVGIYGVIAFLVEQRTKEIGVRMALGARPSRILSMILSRAVVAIAAGLAIGFIGAAWLERLVMAFVHRGVPHDPAVYGGAAALLLALGLLAAYVPARRAAHVDPLVAIRTE